MSFNTNFNAVKENELSSSHVHSDVESPVAPQLKIPNIEEQQFYNNIFSFLINSDLSTKIAEGISKEVLNNFLSREEFCLQPSAGSRCPHAGTDTRNAGAPRYRAFLTLRTNYKTSPEPCSPSTGSPRISGPRHKPTYPAK